MNNDSFEGRLFRSLSINIVESATTLRTK